MDNVEDEDSTRNTCGTNTRYEYSTYSPEHPSGLDPSNYFWKNVGFIQNISSVIFMVVYCKPCKNIFAIHIVREEIRLVLRNYREQSYNYTGYYEGCGRREGK